MKKKKNIILNIDLPQDEYSFLEIICAKKGVSPNAFAQEVLLKAIEDYEDELWAKRAIDRLKASSKTILWEEACLIAGWTDIQE